MEVYLVSDLRKSRSEIFQGYRFAKVNIHCIGHNAQDFMRQ